MEKRHFNRNRRLTTAAALAIAGTAGLSSIASAALTLQLTTSTGSSTFGSTSTSISAGSTAPITLDIWAQVTGTGANPELLQSADFSLYGPASPTSTGGGTIVGNYSVPTLLAPFKASGAQDSTTTPSAGTGAPLAAGDGNDVGSTNVSDVTNWMVARAGTPVQLTTGGALTQSIANGFEVKLGTVTFTPSTGVTAGSSILSIVGRQNINGALWFEDATSTTGTAPGPVWGPSLSPGAGGGTYANGLFTINVSGGGPNNSVWNRDSNVDNSGAGGNWTLSTNWTGGVPGTANTAALGDVANFTSTGDSSGTRLVRLDSNETVGGIVFNPTPGSGYTISPVVAQAITLNNGTTANPTITSTTGTNVVAAAVTLGQNSTVSVAVGSTLTLSSLSSTASALTKTGGGALSVDKLRTGAVSVSAGTLSVLANNGTTGGRSTSASKVASLSISGGTVDLTNNTMVISNTSAGNGGSGLVGVGGLIRSGKLTTSSGPVGGLSVALGYAQGNDPNLGISGTVAGQSFGAADTIVKFTYQGDANLDGSVDGVDVGDWQNGFTGTGGGFTQTWTVGDWNGDGAVDGVDVGLWQNNFTGTGGGALQSPALGGSGLSGVSAVPEPASLGLLLAAGLPLMRRRRNKQ